MLKGIILRLTISKEVTPAISAIAISTPATGLTVRPIEAAKFIGKIMEADFTPNFAAIFGTNGAKAKNAALPLPISMLAKNIIKVSTTPIPKAPKPTL